jgi:hypothetical protein
MSSFVLFHEMNQHTHVGVITVYCLQLGLSQHPTHLRLNPIHCKYVALWEREWRSTDVACKMQHLSNKTDEYEDSFVGYRAV